MLRRWDRIQHAILESFTPRGTRPIPIWNLYQLEPDDEQRAYLLRKLSRLGAREHDFLRWRNACVAYSLPESLEALRTFDGSGIAPLATPLWVTNHLLRRKVHSVFQASIAVHLALVAVPGVGPLVSADEQPLLLALAAANRYNLIHVLPALTSRILALPTKHHDELLTILCKRDLPPSPLAAASLKMVLGDIATHSILLSNQIWQSVWEKWVVLNPLDDDFATSLRLQIRDQGFQAPYYRNIDRSKAYTQAATYFPNLTNPSRQDPTIATLTAAAHSKYVSAHLLLSIASTLADRFFSPHPNHKGKSYSAPNVTFVTALILGLIRKGAYSRAVGAWRNTRISKHKITITPKLIEAAISAHILNGDLEEAVNLLDEYTNPWSKPGPGGDGVRLPSRVLTLLISHLPASAQELAFRQAYKRWGIQPDSAALEAVMVGAAQAVAKQSQGELDLRTHFRELKEVFKSLFRRTPAEEELPESSAPTILDPGPFAKRAAIRLFRNVLLRNWPFIRGTERGYWWGLLEKRAIELFIPPVSLRHNVSTGAASDEDPGPARSFKFTPGPLHPSPTPAYPHACPTRRAWSAYLSLLDPEELTRALEWMRSIDEFLHMRLTTLSTPIDLFRPERAAIIDVLMRWEDAILSGETPVSRAWEELNKGTVDGVGREGALRDWLIEWLGDESVPSRSDIARARIKVED